jgi:NADH-quinone oxidoreductase subunit L
LIGLLGIATSLFAGFVAISQPDVKRVIAYSTCRQVRFMIGAAGLFIPSTGVFLLVTHATYKALLFLAAGGVIHAV